MRRPRDRYTTEEAAKLLGREARTVQRGCRERRVNAVFLATGAWTDKGGRGERLIGSYRLTHAELERVRDHGLLPAGSGRVDEE